jgi:ABC-type multidrug transport system fused ATPase/permease subunit
MLYLLLRLFTSFATSWDWFPIRVARSLYQASTRGQLELRLGITIIAFFVVSSVVGLVLTTRQCRLVADTEYDLSTDMFRLYMSAPYLNHVSRNSAQLLRNTHNIPFELASSGVLAFLQFGQNIMVVLFLLVVIGFASPQVVIISVVYFGAGTAAYLLVVSPRLRRAGKSVVELAGSCLQTLQEGFTGLKAFLTSNSVGTVVRGYEERRQIMADSRYRLLLFANLPQYYLQSLMVGGVVLFAIVVATLHLRNPTAIIGITLAAAIRLMPALYTSLSSVGRFRGAEANINELHGEMKRLINSGPRPAPLSAATNKLADNSEGSSSDSRLQWSGGIHFEHVSFRYPSGHGYALRDLTASITRGEFVGIVGPSGAGKSTIVDMLLGLFDPDIGEIQIGSHRLGAHNVEAWRRAVGYVPQEVFLMDDMVSRNVALGSGDSIDEARVWAALERSQLLAFVEELPERLDTRLGERGVRLSGGQRQRIGIARALYANPDVLVLDEATASLDVKTEEAITATIDQLGEGLTRIVIAHRLSTIKHCDRILVIRNGRLMAEGPFDMLRESDEMFQEMASLATLE